MKQLKQRPRDSLQLMKPLEDDSHKVFCEFHQICFSISQRGETADKIISKQRAERWEQFEIKTQEELWEGRRGGNCREKLHAAVSARCELLLVSCQSDRQLADFISPLHAPPSASTRQVHGGRHSLCPYPLELDVTNTSAVVEGGACSGEYKESELQRGQAQDWQDTNSTLLCPLISHADSFTSADNSAVTSLSVDLIRYFLFILNPTKTVSGADPASLYLTIRGSEPSTALHAAAPQQRVYKWLLQRVHLRVKLRNNTKFAKNAVRIIFHRLLPVVKSRPVSVLAASTFVLWR